MQVTEDDLIEFLVMLAMYAGSLPELQLSAVQGWAITGVGLQYNLVTQWTTLVALGELCSCRRGCALIGISVVLTQQFIFLSVVIIFQCFTSLGSACHSVVYLGRRPWLSPELEVRQGVIIHGEVLHRVENGVEGSGPTGHTAFEIRARAGPPCRHRNFINARNTQGNRLDASTIGNCRSTT